MPKGDKYFLCPLPLNTGGVPDISRGLSVSDTPGIRPNKIFPHPGGVPDWFPQSGDHRERGDFTFCRPPPLGPSLPSSIRNLPSSFDSLSMSATTAPVRAFLAKNFVLVLVLVLDFSLSIPKTRTVWLRLCRAVLICG
jgi:hypothetical protein